ncbi:MAG: molybdenum cofactor guanylyltransferase [Alphaproteobacteria bacterium]|nr:molybdenum cofactor guanylyltransferase [Alphaproteobacteria bacterium]
MSLNVTGLILASGGSSRMGRDKAALEYNGASFLELAVSHLKAVNCDKIYINNADNLTDLIADLGPLGGIYTALSSHPNVPYWLIIPIDMPTLTPEILSHLQQGLHDADVARFDNEMFPILLKSSDQMRNHITTLATDKSQSYSMRQFTKPFNINILPKPKGSEAAFANINSPEDYETLCI